MNLPNLITVGRIVLAVLVVPLLLPDHFGVRLLAFIVFFVAAVSDLWDGYLARSRGLITNLGKLLDPIADKLLLACTFIPFYILSHRSGPDARFPWFSGVFPLWILLVIFGRELFITLFRSYAARRGVVIAAGQSGKYKAFSQNLFIGSAILWYALQAAATDHGWSGAFWRGWQVFHYSFSVVMLTVAVVLTVYSMLVYLWNYRSVVIAGGRAG
ncbi:MAG TPA: CDP-diacylglycerol--glycerol-3-phosphate 3-phosphatidyltransferase [Longimicrobiaceae bacterium]|nr:CDP-diacylglycerol--glycerol-3-phosphate 3-phosphatidyltransferase [Longimicrobiaceae bacterium]